MKNKTEKMGSYEMVYPVKKDDYLKFGIIGSEEKIIKSSIIQKKRLIEKAELHGKNIELISLLRNDIRNLKYDKILEKTHINEEVRKKIQVKIDSLIKITTAIDSPHNRLHLISKINELDADFNSKFPYQPLMEKIINDIAQIYRFSTAEMNKKKEKKKRKKG